MKQYGKVAGLSLALLGVVICWLVIGLAVPMLVADTASGRGTLGDQFGIANSLFSALAFAVIVIALVFQVKAIEAQNKATVAGIHIELLRDIRGREWSDAQRKLRQWHKSLEKEGKDIKQVFTDILILEHERTGFSKCDDINEIRRVFKRPLRKLHVLHKKDLVDKEDLVLLLSPSAKWIIDTIVIPMEDAKREMQGRDSTERKWLDELSDWLSTSDLQ